MRTTSAGLVTCSNSGRGFDMTFQIDILPIALPNGLFNRADWDKIVENTLTAVAKDVEIDFKVTTQTWKGRPAFKIKSKKGYRLISTSNKIYLFVNSGTKAHVIRAKTAGGLRFQGNYRAKTIVNSIMSRAGGSSGPHVVRQEVFHPGTKARNFDVEIGRKWSNLSVKVFDRAVLSALK